MRYRHTILSTLRSLGGRATVRELMIAIGGEPSKHLHKNLHHDINQMYKAGEVRIAGEVINEHGDRTTVWEVVE